MMVNRGIADNLLTMIMGKKTVKNIMEALQATYEKKGYPDEHRLYFRRLSQTTQTDVLLGNLDMTGSGKVILRPLSVQERIRELNLRARMFTDTMLAIQGISPRHSPLPGPRSLQCSPWSSPRILSPVDVRHILASRSTENLSGLASHGELIGSPIRRRWSRRSLRRSVPSKSRSPEGYREYEEVGRKEAEKLLRDGEEELRLHLESLSNRDRVITAHEAKSLVALLHSHDELLLERTLITIANCGTFSANQDAIPLLLTFVNKEQPTEKLLLSALLTLSNIAVLSDWHDEFYPVLHALYQLVDTGAPQVKLQALKLLVNLSCNEDMVPSLLAAQAMPPTLSTACTAPQSTFSEPSVTRVLNTVVPRSELGRLKTQDGCPTDQLHDPKTPHNTSGSEQNPVAPKQPHQRRQYNLAKEDKMVVTINEPHDNNEPAYHCTICVESPVEICYCSGLTYTGEDGREIIYEDCQQYYPYQCLGWKDEPRYLSGLFFRWPPCQRFTSSTTSAPPCRSHLIATCQCPFPSPYPLPTFPDFHGRGYEDPTTFIRRCELQLRTARVDTLEWVPTIQQQLKDTAAQCWKLYREYITT
uniref:Armadillo repeat-containing domain-containing protein n=1 Tax=Timema shepardi TaxID=629360 RepID=A0A7R9AKT8_TIMSH|nr:unnamed protein product [Timema shepardi]